LHVHSTHNSSSKLPEPVPPFPPPSQDYPTPFPSPTTPRSLRFKSNNLFQVLVQERVEPDYEHGESNCSSPGLCPTCGGFPAHMRGQDAASDMWLKESSLYPPPSFLYPVNMFYGSSGPDPFPAESPALPCAYHAPTYMRIP
jgi:hypothetical protein